MRHGLTVLSGEHWLNDDLQSLPSKQGDWMPSTEIKKLYQAN